MNKRGKAWPGGMMGRGDKRREKGGETSYGRGEGKEREKNKGLWR